MIFTENMKLCFSGIRGPSAFWARFHAVLFACIPFGCVSAGIDCQVLAGDTLFERFAQEMTGERTAGSGPSIA